MVPKYPNNRFIILNEKLITYGDQWFYSPIKTGEMIIIGHGAYFEVIGRRKIAKFISSKIHSVRTFDSSNRFTIGY